jgi:hypothetical protein
MAECEARGGVYQRLPERGRSGERVGAVLRLLQPPAVAPVATVPNTGSGVLAMIGNGNGKGKSQRTRYDSTHLSQLIFYLNFAGNWS